MQFWTLLIFFFSLNTQVVLHLIDYNSKDGDYEQILKKSNLRYKYYNAPMESSKGKALEEIITTKGNVSAPVRFNKVKMLNYGIKKVQNKNSIIFILDLHLQLPPNMFDRMRKVFSYDI